MTNAGMLPQRGSTDRNRQSRSIKTIDRTRRRRVNADSFTQQLVQLFTVVINVVALDDNRRDKDHFVARDC